MIDEEDNFPSLEVGDKVTIRSRVAKIWSIVRLEDEQGRVYRRNRGQMISVSNDRPIGALLLPLDEMLITTPPAFLSVQFASTYLLSWVERLRGTVRASELSCPSTQNTMTSAMLEPGPDPESIKPPQACFNLSRYLARQWQTQRNKKLIATCDKTFSLNRKSTLLWK